MELKDLAGWLTGGATFLATGNPALAAGAYSMTNNIIGGGNNNTPANNNVRTPNRDILDSAFKDIQNITSPAYKQSGESITNLLSRARQQYEPLMSTTYQDQLKGVISGDIDITSLPGFEAQSRALTNVLASKGLSMSESTNLAAFQPLISGMFSQLQKQATGEQLMNQQIAGSIADLFRYEAGTAGMLPVQEAQQVIGGGLQEYGIDTGYSQFQQTMSDQQRQRQAKQESEMLSGLLEFGMEYGDDIMSIFSGSDTGSDVSGMSYDYNVYG